jgi:hypothetical protein
MRRSRRRTRRKRREKRRWWKRRSPLSTWQMATMSRDEHASTTRTTTKRLWTGRYAASPLLSHDID